MNEWLENDKDKLRSLIADEAKQVNMLNAVSDTIRQMKAKSQFRIALLNQLLENYKDHK